MGNEKIADSIIIRVGGGIRAIPREPAEIAEKAEAIRRDAGFERPDDRRPFEGEGPDSKIGRAKL